MTNVTLLIRQAAECLLSAQRDHHKEHDNLAKRNLERATGLLAEAIGSLEEDAIIDVCQWCGDEAVEDHPAARCVKG